MEKVEGAYPEPQRKRLRLMRLRHTRSAVWSWREESNLQPAVYKTAALPIELRQHANEISGLG